MNDINNNHKKISIEYCHIYPGRDINQEIKDANYWMPKMIALFDDRQIQKCIMLDDINTTIKIDNNFIQSLVTQLIIKPDCIYLESAFIPEAHKIVEAIDVKQRDLIHSDERTFLREYVERYKTTTEFLLSWKDKSGKTEYSCPSLSATSYLVRLGFIKGQDVKTVYGTDLDTADYILNILSSYYLQVEDKAQSIIEATFKQALRKIGWFFY